MENTDQREEIRIIIARPVRTGLWLGLGFALLPVVISIVMAIIVIALMSASGSF
jgi:hypothetical protein